MLTGLDLVPIIKSVGYAGIFSAILLENGIPLLFFVPGDTLLLTAGFLASQGYLDIQILVIGGFITAILGYMLGYHLGHQIGRKVFETDGQAYIKREHLEKTKEFYNKYGSISLLIARFLPLRACVCFLAGSAGMSYRTFMIFNILGAFAWGVLLPLMGFYLGRMIPVDDLKTLAVVPVLGVVFMLALVPAITYVLKRQSKKAKADPPDGVS